MSDVIGGFSRVGSGLPGGGIKHYLVVEIELPLGQTQNAEQLLAAFTHPLSLDPLIRRTVLTRVNVLEAIDARAAITT